MFGIDPPFSCSFIQRKRRLMFDASSWSFLQVFYIQLNLVMRASTAKFIAQCNWAHGNWNINSYYFLTCVHALRRVEPRSNFDLRSRCGSKWNGVQLMFLSEPRWCKTNYDWTEIKVEFELKFDPHWCTTR